MIEFKCRQYQGSGKQIAEQRYDNQPGSSVLMETCMRCLGRGKRLARSKRC